MESKHIMIESILQFDNVGMLPGIFCTQFKVLSIKPT